jgi:hypothetical protein
MEAFKFTKMNMISKIKACAHSQETEAFRAVGDDSAVAIAIWQTDHSLLFINNHAARLTGFANTDLFEATAQWGEQVHVNDRANFSSSWGELRKGTRRSTCEYRFFPKHSKSAVRVMELSVLIPGLQLVASVYFRIADRSEEPKYKETERVLRTLLHNLQNHLHVIKMEIELSELGLRRTIDVAQRAKMLSSVGQLPRDLRDYLGANAMSMTIEDLESVLEKIVGRIQRQLHREKANLRLVRRGPLPPLEVDKNQACVALERIVESCRLRLKKGGDIKIEAEQIGIRGQPDAESQVTTTSPESVRIEGYDSLRSSVRAGEDQVEIALDLAHEILRRYPGEVTFRQENVREGK